MIAMSLPSKESLTFESEILWKYLVRMNGSQNEVKPSERQERQLTLPHVETEREIHGTSRDILINDCS